MSVEEKIEKLSKLICGDSSNPVCRIAVHQLVKTMEKTCNECQADRRVLLLDPLCYGRFYLSLLIEASLPASHIPKDCYEIRLEEIKKVLGGRPVAIPCSDSVIRLKDFLMVLAEITRSRTVKRTLPNIQQQGQLRKTLLDLLSKKSVNATYVEGKRKIFIFIDTGKQPVLCIADLERRTVLVNPDSRLPRVDDLEPLIDLLMKKFGLEGTLHRSISGNIYLQVSFEQNVKPSTLRDFRENLGVALINRADGTKILSIRIVENNTTTLSYSEILRLIKLLAGGYGWVGKE